jgi:hypothetical protein
MGILIGKDIFIRSDIYNLISMINYYQNNSAWVKNLIMSRQITGILIGDIICLRITAIALL